MTVEAANWIPAIAVLVAGLIGGLVVIFVSRGRRGQLAREDELESREDLEQRRDLLVARLREMRDSSDSKTREQLETETAGVLRKIEENERASDGRKELDVRPEKSPQTAQGASLKGFLWGIGVAVVVGSIVFFVSDSATEREEGGSLTGGVEAGSQLPQQVPPQQQVPPELAALEQWVAENPDDLDARLELARVYIMQQEMMKVWDQTSYVLEKVPNHPRAKGYQAVVRLAMGQTAVAFQMLEEALEADPTLLDARIHLALAYLQMGRPQEAVRTLEEAKKIHPAQSPMLDQLIQEIMVQWPEVRPEE